jgi:hypothetical protein
MKKLLLVFSFLLFTLSAKSQNIGVPNYNQQKIDFYLGNVTTPSNTLSSGVGNVNGVTFFGSDMFVAGNANGILWYEGVSFNPYNLAGKTPTLLTTGSGTTQVAVDVAGNVYAANENGTVTKFFRKYFILTNTYYYSNSFKVTVRFSNDLTSGITIGKVNNIECVWVNNYTSSSISVARTIDFPASGTVTTVNKAVFVKLITAHPDPNNEGIALDAVGNLWLASNESPNGYCSKVVSTRVSTIVNGLNATANADYALVMADWQLHVLTNGYKLGGLTYDDIYTNRMYCNDQPADGSSQSVTRNVLAFNPATATVTTIAGNVTSYLQTNPGNGQAAIIPCGLLPTPIASGTTINAGQTATLTASNCVAGAGYEWRDVGLSVVGSASSFTTPVLSTNTVYTVKCINSSACQSPALTVNVTVNPVTGPFSITPANLQTICVPNTTLTALNCGGTVSWYEDTNGSGSTNVFLGTGSTFNFALGSNLNYYVRATCTVGAVVSPFSNYSVIRTGPTVTPQSYIISPGASKTFTASGCPSGTTYLWDSGETTPTITKSLTVPSQYPTTYNVKCVSGSCNSNNGFAYLYVGAILANNDNYTVTAGTPFSNNFTSNDQALSPRIIQIDPYPTHGNLTYDNTGAFTFTSTAGYTGTDFFEYYLTNGSGSLSNYARVNLTICPAASTSIVSGDWSVASTWQCGAIPIATKQVEIQSGHIINVTGNVHAKDVKLIGTGKINYTGTTGKLFLNQ